MRPAGPAALLALCLAACAPLEDASPPSPPRERPSLPVFSPPRGFRRLRLGLVPSEPAEALADGHRRLGAYLEKHLGVPVEVRVAGSYAEALERVLNGEDDLAELSPSAYLEALRRGPLACPVQLVAGGSATSSGYVLVRDDSPLHSVQELKGTRLALVDPLSTNGYLAAREALHEQGLELGRDFAQVRFLGTHRAVLLAVRDGEVEAGASFPLALGALRRALGVDPRSFRVLAKAPRTPLDVLCIRVGLPPEVEEAVKQALLALDGRERAGREILGPLGLNGYAPLEPAAHEVVRRMAEALGAP